MNAPSDRILLVRWLAAAIRSLFARTRKRHPGVLPGNDLEIITEILNHIRGDVGNRAE